MARPPTAYVGLGSNLGDRLATLRAAVARLDGLAGIRVVACSPVYESAPLGPVLDQPAFLNAVCAIETSLSPRALLERLLLVEEWLGRVRDVPKGPRTVDLDLLLYDSLVLAEEGLRVPHPAMRERAFVLRPLLDITPGLRHPEGDEPLEAALSKLEGQVVVPFAPPGDILPPERARGPV